MRAFRIAYDGTAYRGFQRQPHGDTVSDELLRALTALGVVERGTVPSGYAAAGRTDAGVSALAQTVAFDAPPWLAPRAVNSELPETIRAWASASVPESFHATHDATERIYEYDLHAPTADRDRARTALDLLSGSHDVANLTPDDERTERHVSASLVGDPSPSESPDALSQYLRLRFRAGGFPRQFVRRAVELIRRVAVGEASVETVERVLDPEPLPGPEGIPPATPDPLVLVGVEYPGVEFTRDEEAVSSAVEGFDRRRIDRLTRSRVAGRIRRGIESGTDE